MVRLTRIYTRGGDRGETSLGDGSRVPKQALRVEAYGTVDEANAAIGLARLHVSSAADGDGDAMLARIQNDLFDLGADLCTPEDGRRAAGALRIVAAQVERLEREIDRMNKALKPLDSFILPGGTAAAAHLHLARTVTRRAERLVCALAAAEAVNPKAVNPKAVNPKAVNPEAVKYLNRLSDHLFVLGRRVNDNGARDVLWQPGATRGPGT
jgi:cob(I)alamin adenosyltransferase